MISDYERASMDWIYIKYIDQIYIAFIKKSLQRPLPSKYTWHRRGIYVLRSLFESMVCLWAHVFFIVRYIIRYLCFKYQIYKIAVILFRYSAKYRLLFVENSTSVGNIVWFRIRDIQFRWNPSKFTLVWCPTIASYILVLVFHWDCLRIFYFA